MFYFNLSVFLIHLISPLIGIPKEQDKAIGYLRQVCIELCEECKSLRLKH
jgi:hypothetical protein